MNGPYMCDECENQHSSVKQADNCCKNLEYQCLKCKAWYNLRENAVECCQPTQIMMHVCHLCGCHYRSKDEAWMCCEYRIESRKSED